MTSYKKKRIVFRVVGHDTVGMGHIYRTISLAEELYDHEVLFVLEQKSDLAAKELGSHKYWVGRYGSNSELVEALVDLKPDLVINDILDTTEEYVRKLKDEGIRVVNFEDLGQGAVHADLTFNELYDEPKFSGGNIYWGVKYFFVRDEFLTATPNKFEDNVTDVLITFGGTDQHDLSRKIYKVVKKVCKINSVNLHIVTGPGYRHYLELVRETSSNNSVHLTHATGVISKVMEKVQVAITSNGRTVYELAHMNIPSIVISQHDRERTHDFACEENGVVPLGLYEEGITEERTARMLEKLIIDTSCRNKLYDRIRQFSFSGNKENIIMKVNSLL